MSNIQHNQPPQAPLPRVNPGLERFIQATKVAFSGDAPKFSHDPLISIPILKQVCTAPEEWFRSFGTWDEKTKTIFIDRGANILGVAHLDISSFAGDRRSFFTAPNTELNSSEKGIIYPGQLVFNPNLDDRLGVYLLLYYLPLFGLHFDVLLTTDEEVGMSTAENWTPPKKYNWAFEPDRRGEDAVVYQYEKKEWLDALSKHFKIGQGSFSDISVLNAGCCAVNFAIGYQDEHTPYSWANLEVTYRQVLRFVEFYREFSGAFFEYTMADRICRQELMSTAWKSWREDWSDYDRVYRNTKTEKDTLTAPTSLRDSDEGKYAGMGICHFCKNGGKASHKGTLQGTYWVRTRSAWRKVCISCLTKYFINVKKKEQFFGLCAHCKLPGEVYVVGVTKGKGTAFCEECLEIKTGLSICESCGEVKSSVKYDFRFELMLCKDCRSSEVQSEDTCSLCGKSDPHEIIIYEGWAFCPSCLGLQK